jgi:excisionase family DNA binding protein
MTPKQVKQWASAKLAEIEPQIGERPTPEHAALIAEAKAHCYQLGLHEFALSLPDDAERKTALTAANQLRRVMAALTASDAAPADSELLTVKQAAQRYQMGMRTIYRLIETGALPPVRMGRSIRLKPADFDRFLADSESAFR